MLVNAENFFPSSIYGHNRQPCFEFDIVDEKVTKIRRVTIRRNRSLLNPIWPGSFKLYKGCLGLGALKLLRYSNEVWLGDNES